MPSKIRDTPAPEPDMTYPQGFEAFAERIARNARGFTDLSEAILPDPDMDFAPLKDRILPPRNGQQMDKPNPRSYAANSLWMQFRLANHTELFHLTACLIMMSRRDNFPVEMQRLWFRLWDEEAPFLTETLSMRWQISALRTFGQYGRTELERRLGRELFLVTGMMKLADTERSYSGLGADEHFRLGSRKDGPVSLGLEPYSSGQGDLDEHVLFHLWETVEALDGTGPGLLGASVLNEINRCPRTVFRRLMTIRDKLRRAQARWQNRQGSK